jgi:hypothetical protein
VFVTKSYPQILDCRTLKRFTFVIDSVPQYSLVFGNIKMILRILKIMSCLFRILTPMAMDQWGWNEEDTILYLGITMACGGVLVRAGSNGLHYKD